MTSAEIADAFISTRETLENAGLEDPFFLDLVGSRLVVERIGETKNMDWWESRVLSETGRARLSEVTPKTRLKSRITLAQEVGRKVEADRLPADSVSLYSFGPQLESRLDADLDDLEGDEDASLEKLEELTVRSVDGDWTEPIIAEMSSKVLEEIGDNNIQDADSGNSWLLDDSAYTQEEVEEGKWHLLGMLLLGYGKCVETLQIPYFQLTSELQSQSQ